jgi:hypothetical protein
MSQLDALLKKLDESGNLILSPYTLSESLIKKAQALTSQELIKQLLGQSNNSAFNSERAEFSDPILSQALSQYSLKSSQVFIDKHYDISYVNEFIASFGIPSICLLTNDESTYQERFINLFRYSTIYVLDAEKFCPEFISFLSNLKKTIDLKYISVSSSKATNNKSNLQIATILAPVFVCDAIELKCLKDSIRFSRCSSLKLSHSSVYQSLSLFCDFYLNPSTLTAIPMLQLMLSDELVRNKKQLMIIANNVFDLFTSQEVSGEFELPNEVAFLQEVAQIGCDHFQAVINYLIYFSPLFEGLPIERKRLLEDYLLRDENVELPIDFNKYDHIELISDIDSEWRFKHNVYISEHLSLTSYPVIANKQTTIELMEP